MNLQPASTIVIEHVVNIAFKVHILLIISFILLRMIQAVSVFYGQV